MKTWIIDWVRGALAEAAEQNREPTEIVMHPNAWESVRRHVTGYYVQAFSRVSPPPMMLFCVPVRIDIDRADWYVEVKCSDGAHIVPTTPESSYAWGQSVDVPQPFGGAK